MDDEAPESAALARPLDQRRSPPKDQYDLPDRWCFGLSHPYVQRLIFLAGVLEGNAVDLRDRDRPPGVHLGQEPLSGSRDERAPDQEGRWPGGDRKEA